MTVFIDTGYFVARLVPRDQWASVAIAAEKPGMQFVTSALIVNETLTLLQNRGLLAAALEFLREVRAASDTQIIYVDAALQSEAWNLFHRYAGSGANPVDCASFAIMKRLGIRRAFTFDTHFTAAGFEILH